jgi:hypothetical protein
MAAMSLFHVLAPRCHHFPGKNALFVAVYQVVQAEVATAAVTAARAARAQTLHESLALVFVVAAKPAHGLIAFVAALRSAVRTPNATLFICQTRVAGSGGRRVAGYHHHRRQQRTAAGPGSARTSGYQ